MSGRNHAYLDLAALPAVGSVLLSRRPTFLFAADARRILWANAPGARFFGARDMAELLERSFSSTLPATEQIARFGRQAATGATRLERISFATGGRLQMLAASCTRIELPDGAPAVLVGIDPGRAAQRSIGERADELVRMIAAEDCLIAVLDDDGEVIAASGGFDVLSAGEAATAELATAMEQSGERLVKRAFRTDDSRRSAGLARFEADEGTFHLLVVGPAQRVVVEPVQATSEADKAPMPVLQTWPAGGAVEADANAEEAAAGAEPEVADNDADHVVGASDPIEVVEAPADNAAAPVSSEATVAEPVIPAADVGDEVEMAGGEAVADEVQPSVGFAFVPPEGPVRFVFQMDQAGRFSFVSPDFAAVVGPHSAAVVGELWGDVAARLDLDAAGQIARLIARRDTWSGVTLTWPVDGAPNRVTVDLAALPAFSRMRVFEGYRGFGVIRPSDGPVANAQPSVPRAAEAAAVPEPPIEVATPPPSNVVRLSRPAASAETDRLSVPEQDAFRRIAAALGAPPPEAIQPEPATAKPESVEPAAESTEPGQPSVSERADPAMSEPVAPLIEPVAVPAEAVEPLVPPVAEAVDAAIRAETVSDIVAEPSISNPVEPDAVFHTEAVSDAADADAPEVAIVARVDERIVEAEQKITELELILDTATDGVVVVDGDGRIERINRSAEALFGVESASVSGWPFVDLLADESRKSALDYLDGLASNGVASLLNDGREVIGRVPQGGLIPLFMTMGRLGETGKFCAVLRDITQWKNAEEELITARRTAESASMQKSDFLAKISHEIRTPLNAIIGFSEVMMEERFGPIGTERYKEYLRDIHVSGAHLMSLLNDLLDLSKIEAGKLDLSFEAVSLNDIVMECVALMQPQANRERIIIRTSLSGQVPSIVADTRSIRQIVLNLVSNAIKFTLAGGQVIVSTTMEDRGEVALRIRDTGIGMSDKDIEMALKPFRQLATSSRPRNDGTGLGLPLTKALVEANRAAFAIDSAVGQGTLIRITFPTNRVLAG